MGKKQEIAEVLYGLPTNKVSTELIRYVMSHMPDEDNKGTNSTRPSTFKHDEEDLYAAIGMKKEDILTLGMKLQDSFVEKTASKKSLVLEKFYTQLNDSEKIFMISEGVESFQRFCANFVLEEFGPDGLEKLTGEKMTADKRKEFENMQALKKHMEIMKKMLDQMEGGPDGE